MSQILNFAAWFPLVFHTTKATDPYHGGSFWFQDVLYFLWIGGFAQFIGILCPTAEVRGGDSFSSNLALPDRY
jgi:hypothetical protein